LDHLQRDAAGAEIVEIYSVGQQPRLVEHWRAVGHFVEQARRAVEQQLVHFAARHAEQKFGRLFGAFAECAALLLAGGKGAASALGELEGIARQLERLEVESLACDDAHVDESLDPPPQAQGVVHQARTDGAVVVHDA
jgi:hypothetical protein